MPTIIFVKPDNTKLEVNAEAGQSIMQIAVDNAIEEIIGECGGGMSCGTCHVYLDENLSKQVLPASDLENAILEGVVGKRNTSRLSCQVFVEDRFDGAVVQLVESQL